MNLKNDPINICLIQLGYNEKFAQDISLELNKLFKDIDFTNIEQRINLAILEKDTAGLIKNLKDLMFSLEDRGIYRPEAPIRVIKLLINGLNLKNEDIFNLIARAQMTLEEKLKEQEFLASCAAITQLGYIMLKCLVPQVKAASSGEHVFLVIDSFSDNSKIFVDFSIDSIKEINVNLYDVKENHWKLRKDQDISSLETETSEYLTQYYSFFQLASGIGLNHNIHNNLGLAYDKIGRFDEAIDELKAALHLYPDYVEVHNNLGVIYDKMEMPDEAQSELREAIRMNPGYPEAHCNLGNIFYEYGMYDEALREFNSVLSLNPILPEAHFGIGLVLYELKRHEEASEAFILAVHGFPGFMGRIPDILLPGVKLGVSKLK
jgi:tetratricopeptide (TPR) repeat protein